MPTWVFSDGSKLQGLRQLSELATKAGIAIPTGVNPHITALDAANAAIADNATIKVKAGSPLWIPIDGYDPNGGTLTYQITSSNTSVVTATKGDPDAQWAKINVQNIGSMLVYLFGSSNIANFPQVPRPVDQFTSIAETGAYDTTSAGTSLFHRVVKDFVIQAGIPGDPAKNDGDSGSLLPDFDDQFHVDLQHNRTGILSYAKQGDHQSGSSFVEGDYTNDSQWFITDGPTRSLDFNHSVFGLLVEGEGARATIDRTATDANDKPTNDFVITSIDILSSNNEDQVVMLKAAAGITLGTSQITIRVTDADGNFITKVFNVEVEADTLNGSPFINDVSPQSSSQGTAKSVQLVVQDAEGETSAANLQYTAQIVGTVAGATVNVSSSGLLTVTPPSGFAGTIVVDANVKQVSPALTSSDTVDTSGDAQRITFNFAPIAPTGIDLDAASDSGVSPTDNVTRATTLQFVVSGVQSGAQVKLFAGTQEIGTATASGTTATISVNVNTVGLAAGSHVITAKQLVGDETSTASPGITLVYDPTIADFDVTDPVPTTAEGNVDFSYNVENPDETQTGFKYELVDLSTGLASNPPVINQSSGVISWKPSPSQVATHTFKVRATDRAGNQQELPFSLNVSVVRFAQFSLIATDLSGNPITSIVKGQEFFLVGRVEDVRSDATGLEAAFFDVAFDTTFATVTGASIEHGTAFTTDTAGTVGTGVLDEVGGKTTATNLAGNVVTLFRVKMRADKTGQRRVHLEHRGDA